MKRGRKKKLAISLMDYMGKRRDMKRQLKKEGTAELYEVAVRHFLRFVKNPGFCLADLNRALVIDFITYLQGKGLATNTVNTYISSLRALYNMACQESLVPASYYPFENLKLRRAMTARRAIPASLFQQIAQIKVADDPQVELSIDLSLFSFMACGMPFVDIAYLTRQNIRGNELVYHRHKTGRMIRLEITSSMLQLIRKYADRQRATGSSYLFPILHTFLDACAARIVEGNDGSTVLQGKLLHLYNLCGIRLAERTAMRREVVGIDKYKAAVYLSVTGHHAVSGNLFLLHAEVGATVVHELVQLMRPEACCFSILSTPPPSEARLSSSSNWRYISSLFIFAFTI